MRYLGTKDEPSDLVVQSDLGSGASPIISRLTKFRDLPTPYFSAHRGGGKFLLPEGTMNAKRISAARGMVIDAADVRMTFDNVMFDMHDDTVDRTTDGLGGVSNKTAQAMKSFNIDASKWFNSQWATVDTEQPPTVSEILDELGGKANMTMEIKDPASAQPLADMIYAKGLVNHVLVASSTESELAPARAYNIPTMHLNNAGSQGATAFNNGTEYAGVHAQQVVVSNIAALKSIGYKVVAYGVERHVDVDRVGLNLDGYISEDPVYTKGRVLNNYSEYRTTTDPFGHRTYYHGHIPYESTVGPDDRGVFDTSDTTGWWGTGSAASSNLSMSVLMGWACPLVSPSSYTINWNQRYITGGGTDRWGGFVIGCPTDMGYTKLAAPYGVGYECFIRANGKLEIWERSGGATATLLKTTTTTSLVNNTSYPMRLTVTPTQITLTRVDTGANATIADSTYRGPYMHFLTDLTAGQRVQVKDVKIT